MSSQHKVTNSQRQQMIAEAAYFRAERRGFNGGDTVRDWCEAEAEIDAELRKLEDGQLVERVEEALDAAAKRLAGARRKLARLSSDARGEWERDLDKLVALRDALKPKLGELKEQGAQAGRRLREQTEKIGADLSELMRRLEAKGKH
jgi:hypothetical protein